MIERTVEKYIELAEEVATNAHRNQVDRAGVPYINHPRTVASNCSTPEAKIIAWLHDTIEDTVLTREDLIAYGFPAYVIDAVCLLTKSEEDNRDYYGYIRRIKENPLACEVKIADLHHNADLSRIPNPTSVDYKRVEKYQHALRILLPEESETK